MKTISVLFDRNHSLHKGNTHSAECPARVDAIVQHLHASPLDASIDWDELVDVLPLHSWDRHTVKNCSACTSPLDEGEIVCGICESSTPFQWHYVQDVDGDTTYCTPYTAEVVRRAAGLVQRGVHLLLDPSLSSTPYKAVFCVTRPPGHHACTGRRAGFCIENFAIEAIKTASACHVSSTVVLDIDAHHGDGTEEELRAMTATDIATATTGLSDTSLMKAYYVSLHAFGKNIYPGTGAASSLDDPLVINIPLDKDTRDEGWLSAYFSQAKPWIMTKSPRLLVVSCGLDAHETDSLVPLHLTTEAYRELGRDLAGFAIPVLFILEGGYSVPVLGSCVEALLESFV